MRIGYLYGFKAYPPRGGNHVHALELTQGFLQLGHSVSVIEDPSMPGVENFASSPAGIQGFLASINILYVRIDARSTRQWQVLTNVVRANVSCPVVWEINSPANECQAYSWLGGTSSIRRADEGAVRRLRRWLHASQQIPAIYLEERHRSQLAKGVSCAICVSTALARYATDALGVADTLVLPNGGPLVSEQEILQRREHYKRSGFTVFYSGSAMYPWQGLDYLSQVIALAEHVAPDVTFVLAVNQRTSNLPTSDNVVILEHLDRDKILDAICAADACVSLHPDYPWSKYGFHNSPMKLFEYMACMRAVVTSNHAQMREIIRDGEDGLLCENDPQDILRKLLFLRDHPERAVAIGKQAWERIQSDFSWRHNVTETLRVFEQALAAST